jgi:pyruvate formate lyase activating enzyme
MGFASAREFGTGGSVARIGVGFPGGAPKTLGPASHPAAYWEKHGDVATCLLCPHQCLLGEGDRGFCRVRVVKQGAMHTVAYGNLCSLNLDPIEKKPLYHFLPQSSIVSVAMGGCNLRCPNCQNWQISQANPEDVERLLLSPAELARLTAERGVPSVAFTYSEPIVAYEYVRDACTAAHSAGRRTALVTAGYIHERPLRELCASVDAVALDVKSFRDAFYREFNEARLDPVLRALEVFREEGVWVEVSYLMVTGRSDDPKQVEEFARWLCQHLGEHTPLHLLRFHPAHLLTHAAPTPLANLTEAATRAKQAGLHYVYMGNVPGAEGSNTLCPHDGELLVERRGFHVVRNRLDGGCCPRCGGRIAGVFQA